jgi:hypothetical protein
MGVFSLGGWTPQFHARFHESGVTQDTHYSRCDFAYRTVTVYGAPFQRTSARLTQNVCGSYNPVSPRTHGLGCARFARRYFGHLV